MAELVLDVHLEFDPTELYKQRDPTRVVAEASRVQAEVESSAKGARLRHPDPRDVVVKRATDAATGDDVLLVATRWLADGPAHA